MTKEVIINNFISIFRFWLVVRPTDLKQEFLASNETKPEFNNNEFWELTEKTISEIVSKNPNYEMISDVILIKEAETFLNKKANP